MILIMYFFYKSFLVRSACQVSLECDEGSYCYQGYCTNEGINSKYIAK